MPAFESCNHFFVRFTSIDNGGATTSSHVGPFATYAEAQAFGNAMDWDNDGYAQSGAGWYVVPMVNPKAYAAETSDEPWEDIEQRMREVRNDAA